MLLDAETLKKEGGRGEGKAAEDPLLLKARDEVVDWRWWRQYGGRLMALVVAPRERASFCARLSPDVAHYAIGQLIARSTWLNSC